MKKRKPPAVRQGYPVPEAAQQLGVSRAQAFKLIAEARLRSYRIGSRRLVSADAIRDCIKQAEADERAA